MLQVAPRRQWVVARMGAYMHYAVPRMLEREGRLARFYTDFYAGPKIGKALSILPESWRGAAVNKALGRNAPDLPMEAIRSFPWLGLAYTIGQQLLPDSEIQTRLYVRFGRLFANAVARDDLQGDYGLYCYTTAALELLREARRRGWRTVVEQTIAPRVVEEALLAEEQRRFPGWEAQRKLGPPVQATIQRERDEWDLADFVFCPSDFVRDGVVAAGGVPEKCIVVPFGVDERFSRDERQPHPGPLRVLIVGQAGLRKGLGDACETARLLGSTAELRWVGPISLTADARREAQRYVRLTGPIPRTQIFEHFRWADVFFLPSICEGSATVIYEALMSGLPVIATPNTGSIVEDGVDGIIVPVRAPAKAAEALRRLALDRSELDRLREGVVRTRAKASLEAYQERFLAAIDTVNARSGSVPA